MSHGKAGGRRETLPKRREAGKLLSWKTDVSCCRTSADNVVYIKERGKEGWRRVEGGPATSFLLEEWSEAFWELRVFGGWGEGG